MTSQSLEIVDALRTLASPFEPSAQPVFSSDLTVGELILLEEVGFRPVEIVSGAGSASWYTQFSTAGTEADLWASALGSAIDEARSQILSDLERHRADGLVAMRLELERERANLLTCTMLGTAVREEQRRRGPASSQKTSSHSGRGPFTTTLSARDFHLLIRGGYRPAGIVMGTSVVGFSARSVSQALGLSRDNFELEGQTNALYAAREKAMAMLEREAMSLGADGVVGVQISERPVNTMIVHAVELIAVGTAVRRGSSHVSLDPELQLTLDDPAPETFQHG